MTGNKKCNISSDVKRFCAQKGLQTLFEGGNGWCGDDVGRQIVPTRGAVAPNHQLYGVMCDAQPACELSPIVVVCEGCRHQPTAVYREVFRTGASGYGSETQERPNETGCVQERAASASLTRAE